MTLTGEQVRAGRSLARVDQAELARRSLVSLETIKRVERIRGPIAANATTLQAIRNAFASLGVVFEQNATAMGVWRICRGGESPPREGLTSAES